MYARCEYCHQRLTDPMWRKLGYGRDCAVKHGLWIPPLKPRIRKPVVEQDETLFDLEDECPTTP